MHASNNTGGLQAPTKEKEAATVACKLWPSPAPASLLVGCPGVPCHFQILGERDGLGKKMKLTSEPI
jgi:hypothetical protein